MDFVPSKVPRFRYQYLHKQFKLVVYQEYKPLNRIGYRIVSEACDEADFVPIKTDYITVDQVTKSHVDERSLSFYTNIEACNRQAIMTFYKLNENKGLEEANAWRQKYTHIAKVPLTKDDGYMEEIALGYHFNFAPFEKFKIGNYDMEMIDYTVDEMYYLQADEVSPYVTLSIGENNNCYLRIQNEDRRYLPYRVKIKPRDVIRYMRKQITIKRICRNNGIFVESELGMYSYCKDSYILGREDIVNKMFKLITDSSDIMDKIFRIISFRRPIL